MLAFGLGAPEIILIVLVAVLFFGGRKIPELARGLGQGIREFQSGMRGKDESKPRAKDPNDKGDSDASGGA